MPVYLPPKTIVAGSNISVADSSTSATVSVANVGSPNGIAGLDSGGKVPITQLPSSIMEYKGTWNASTNTPTLADGTGDTGDTYRVSVGGTRNLGSGSITFDVGDYCIYNGSIWEKSDTTDAVASINGLTGNVVLTTTNIADSTDKRYVTDAQKTILTNTSGTNTGDQSIFSTIAVSGQSDVVADNTSDTLTLAAGSGITITTNATTDTITIASTGGGGGRETLTANRTYYVSTTGSDSNNGLTAGAPFLTIQKAIDVTAGLDMSIYNVTIQLAAGTYTHTPYILCKQCVGSGTVTILGNISSPGSYIIAVGGSANNSRGVFSQGINTVYVVRGVKLINNCTGSGVNAIMTQLNSTIKVAYVEFGAGSQTWMGHMRCDYGGIIEIINNYTISSGCGFAHVGGFFNAIVKLTEPEGGTMVVKLVGTLSLANFVNIQSCSCMFWYSAVCSFDLTSGSNTGGRVAVAVAASVGTQGGGDSYFPGTGVPSTGSSGYYS